MSQGPALKEGSVAPQPLSGMDSSYLIAQGVCHDEIVSGNGQCLVAICTPGHDPQQDCLAMHFSVELHPPKQSARKQINFQGQSGGDC